MGVGHCCDFLNFPVRDGARAGCGGLTGVTPITLYRAWIVETVRKLGSPLPP